MNIMKILFLTLGLSTSIAVFAADLDVKPEKVVAKKTMTNANFMKKIQAFVQRKNSELKQMLKDEINRSKAAVPEIEANRFKLTPEFSDKYHEALCISEKNYRHSGNYGTVKRIGMFEEFIEQNSKYQLTDGQEQWIFEAFRRFQDNLRGSRTDEDKAGELYAKLGQLGRGFDAVYGLMKDHQRCAKLLTPQPLTPGTSLALQSAAASEAKKEKKLTRLKSFFKKTASSDATKRATIAEHAPKEVSFKDLPTIDTLVKTEDILPTSDEKIDTTTATIEKPAREKRLFRRALSSSLIARIEIEQEKTDENKEEQNIKEVSSEVPAPHSPRKNIVRTRASSVTEEDQSAIRTHTHTRQRSNSTGDIGQ